MTERRPSLERRPEVQARTGLKTSSLYAQMQRGEFPRPVKLGPRSVAWPSDAVDQWIESRTRSVGAKTR